MYVLKILFSILMLSVGTLANAQEVIPQIIDDGGLTGRGSWSADGGYVAFLAENYLLVYDVNQRESDPRRIAYPFGQALDVAYSPDGRYLATINLHETNGLVLYDTQTLEVVQTFDYAGTVIGWSSDGGLLALGNSDQLLILDGETFTITRSVDIPEAVDEHVGIKSYRVEFAFDDQLVILKYDLFYDWGNHGGEFSATLFEWLNSESAFEFSPQQQLLAGDFGQFAFHPNGEWIVARDGEQLILANFNTLEILQDLPFSRVNRENSMYSVPVFSPNGDKVAFFNYLSAPLVAQIYVGDTETGDLLAAVDVDITREGQLFFSPDGQHIGFNGQIIDIAAGTVTRLSSTRVFSSDDVNVAADYAGAIYISQNGGYRWMLLDYLDDPVCNVRFAPNGAYFVTMTCDKQWILWETQTQRRTPLGETYGVTFSSDSRLMLILGGIPALWDVERGERIDFDATPDHGVVWFIQFAPDSRVLLMIAPDYDVYLWKPFADGDESLVRLDIRGDRAWNFSPSGDYVIFEDRLDEFSELVAIDTRTGEEISHKTMEHTASFYTYGFSFNEEETEVTYAVQIFFPNEYSYVETWQFR